MTMLPFHVLLVGVCLSVAYAIDLPIYITTPSQVTAGVSFKASIDAEVHNGLSRYANSFRVYLAISYQDKAHYFYDSDCFLIHEQTLCDSSVEIAGDYVSFKSTSFNVTIPPTVGPSGTHYVLVARTFKTDGSWYGASLDSEVFELIGANGTWSSFQKSGIGRTLWGSDSIPCGSYVCVKECADATITDKNTTMYHECANNCPNVSIDFENSTVGGQPTATLTKPPQCTSTASVTAIDAKSTTDVTNPGETRSATAAAGTGAATLTSEVLRSFFTGLALLVAIFFTADS